MSGLSARTGGLVSSADERKRTTNRIKAMPAGLANKVFNARRTGVLNLDVINLKIAVVPKPFQQVGTICGIFIQKTGWFAKPDVTTG